MAKYNLKCLALTLVFPFLVLVSKRKCSPIQGHGYSKLFFLDLLKLLHVGMGDETCKIPNKKI